MSLLHGRRCVTGRFASALCLLLFACSAAGTGAEGEQEQPADCVVLLHGLWRTGMSMKPLEWRLEEAGYRVSNVTYPSLLYSIEELAERALERGLAQCREAHAPTINIVTHSLGGILVRQYLRQHRVEELGRVVMLGPPNQGSQVADFFEGLDNLDFLTPAAVDQLTTDEASLTRQLGPVDFEVGVVAGTAGRGIFVFAENDEVSDGTVTVEETRVAGMTDFITLPTSHTFMIWDGEVIRQVLYFLDRGRFDKAALAAPAADPG